MRWVVDSRKRDLRAVWKKGEARRMDSWAAKSRAEGPMVRVMMGELRLLGTDVVRVWNWEGTGRGSKETLDGWRENVGVHTLDPMAR